MCVNVLLKERANSKKFFIDEANFQIFYSFHAVKYSSTLFPLSVCLCMSATTTTAEQTTTTTSEEEEVVILALQRERKNQWESFKKFGEFRNKMSSSSTTKRGGGGKLTALGYLYACISAIVFLLYWFVDAVDGRYASLLLLASCFVVRVHPAFNSANGKLK